MGKLVLLLPLVPILLLIVGLVRREQRSNIHDLWVGDVAPSKPAPLLPDLPAFVACYALYAMLIAMGYVVVFMIWRSTILTLLAAFVGLNDVNRFIYLLLMWLMGIGLFVLVMAAEPYMRSGIRGRQLMRRFGRLAVYLGAAGALGLILQVLAMAIM